MLIGNSQRWKIFNGKCPANRQKETLLSCPEEKDLDALINAAQSKTMAAFLQTLKETYADPSEILFAEWSDLKDRTLTLYHGRTNEYLQ